jgi:hypothetical protein
MTLQITLSAGCVLKLLFSTTKSAIGLKMYLYRNIYVSLYLQSRAALVALVRSHLGRDQFHFGIG